MTIYPNSQDNYITLPGVSGSSEEDTSIMALRDATFAIEKELGIVPSGVYADVRTRLDILESRINFSVSPSIPNDGYVRSPLFILNVANEIALTISDGYGVPTENRLNGSLYLQNDGYTDQGLYIRRDGYWVQVPILNVVIDRPLSTPYQVVTRACEHVVLVPTHSGTFTINLPVSPNIGTVVVVKDYAGVASGNLIEIAATALIDGAATYVISTNYGKTRLLYDGFTWSTI